MKGLNKAYLIGNIGQDPELRSTAQGKSIVKLSLATPNVRKVNDEWIDTPDWHRLTLFDKNAEFIATYAKKGHVVAVECAIRPSKWTDKDNVVRYAVDLIVDRVLWLSPPRGAMEKGSGKAPAPPALEGGAIDPSWDDAPPPEAPDEREDE